MTINDIARLSGVSKSTVSRYLTGGSVSKRSAEKIARIIEETGFVANVAASRLRNNRSYLIGVLVDGITGPSVTHMLQGINNGLRARGYQPFFMIYETTSANKVAGIQALVQQGVDGILLGEAQLTKEHIRYLAEINLPAIILGQQSDAFPYCKVDDYAGGKLLAAHLNKQLDRGGTPSNDDETVVYLSFPHFDAAAGEERWRGFSDGMAHEGRKVLKIEAGYERANGYAAGRAALEAHPQAIVGASDVLCYGVWDYLAEQNLRVPQDIMLAGFGDHEGSSLPTVSLTSVTFGYQELGEDAAGKIVDMIEGHEIPHRNTNYSCTLVARTSTCGTMRP